ncbi:hypothetical protein N7G274_004311 [Stereocaulon virgatum]|uniref:Secreted protein n=1 Tax=Stereocaulon virgatum TaxID=373712 RepID=A0ABR4AEI5_9LECA
MMLQLCMTSRMLHYGSAVITMASSGAATAATNMHAPAFVYTGSCGSSNSTRKRLAEKPSNRPNGCRSWEIFCIIVLAINGWIARRWSQKINIAILALGN